MTVDLNVVVQGFSVIALGGIGGIIYKTSVKLAEVATDFRAHQKEDEKFHERVERYMEMH